jgi:hypothetical protein
MIMGKPARDTFSPLRGNRRHSAELFFVRGIDQNEAFHFLWISGCIISHIDTADGMSDQYTGSWNAGLVQELVKILDDFGRRLRQLELVTVSQACAIITANSREFLDALLD